MTDEEQVLAEAGELLCRLAAFSTALLETNAALVEVQLALSKMAARVRDSE